MVAGATVEIHFRHRGVRFVIEVHRLIQIGQLIQHHGVGRVGQLVFTLLMHHLRPRA